MHPNDASILLDLFNRLNDECAATLVGGQCLLAWATHYEHKGLEGLSLTTHDIDIIGSPATVDQLEAILNITASRPGMDDQTPEVGVFRGNIDGQKLVVDVLASVAGLSHSELKKYSTVLTLEGVTIPLLDPVGVLKCRLANVILLKRTDDHTREQLQASIIIARHYINDILSSKGYRDASKIIKDVLAIAESRDAISAYKQFAIDVVEAIPKTHPNYPEAFVDGHLRICVERIIKKRG